MTPGAVEPVSRLEKADDLGDATDGVRSHSYTVTVGDHVDEYTFVLRGRREYQLLCRRKASHGDDACRQLLTSFATT